MEDGGGGVTFVLPDEDAPLLFVGNVLLQTLHFIYSPRYEVGINFLQLQ